MIEVDARPVLALVMELQPFGDRAERLLPEQPMERHVLPVALAAWVSLTLVDLPFVAGSHLSITKYASVAPG
jgi:hypothetical protein